MKPSEEQLFKSALNELLAWKKEFSKFPRILEDGEYRERKEKRFDWLWTNFKEERKYMNKPMSKTERLRLTLLQAANWQEFATPGERATMPVSEAQQRVVDRLLHKFMQEPVINENTEPEFDLLITGQDTALNIIQALGNVLEEMQNDWMNNVNDNYGNLRMQVKKA